MENHSIIQTQKKISDLRRLLKNKATKIYEIDILQSLQNFDGIDIPLTEKWLKLKALSNQWRKATKLHFSVVNTNTTINSVDNSDKSTSVINNYNLGIKTPPGISEADFQLLQGFIQNPEQCKSVINFVKKLIAQEVTSKASKSISYDFTRPYTPTLPDLSPYQNFDPEFEPSYSPTSDFQINDSSDESIIVID